MGWRDTQRQVASGELSFKPEAPSDFQQGIGMLLKTGANYIQDQEDRRREEAMKLMEEQKVKNEELNKKRKAKNALERQRRSKAISILANLGENAKNPNFQRHVISNLELFDDDSAKVMEYYKELGNQLQSVASKKNMTARGRQGDLNQQTAEVLGADTRAMFDTKAGDTKPPTPTDMEMRESSGVSTEVSVDPKDGKKYGGLVQMGQARLQDYNEKYGTNFTPDTFAQLPEGEQRKINNWHFRDISTFIRNEGLDEYVGEEINGTILTEASLVAIAHLGGKTGLKNYLISGGEKDRKDSNGTYMSTYAKDFADSSFIMEEEQDDPNFASFVIADKKGLHDPFKKPDGTYHTAAQIQLIANDSGDAALIERANKITAPRTTPSSLSRGDLVAKIAVMQLEGRPDAEIAPYQAALQARNDQKAVDDIPDPTTAEGLYFQVEKALIPEGLSSEEYSKRIAAIKNSWNEATSSEKFTPRTLYRIGTQTTTIYFTKK